MGMDFREQLILTAKEQLQQEKDVISYVVNSISECIKNKNYTQDLIKNRVQIKNYIGQCIKDDSYYIVKCTFPILLSKSQEIFIEEILDILRLKYKGVYFVYDNTNLYCTFRLDENI